MDDSGRLHGSCELETVRARLIDAVRGALRRPLIDGETVEHLGAFLRLVELLPEHDEDCTASMRLTFDSGEGAGIWEADFSSEGLELSRTELFRGEWGTDSESKTVFKATAERSSADDGLDEWLHHFIMMAKSDYDLSAWVEE